jgi:pimeloyl-ACP methyl ester carboxylesterase
VLCEHAPVQEPDPDDASFRYDELGLFGENCAELGLPWDGSAAVERLDHHLPDGRRLSGLRWGDGPPRLVLLHGSAQNAHTWDSVALALRPVPVLALDLPGHGRSSWRPDGRYDPRSSAADVADALEALAPGADAVVGMSLGGLTANALAAGRPDLVRRLVVVDITPGVTRDKARDIHAFVEGPQSFPSFGEIFARTVEFNPTRSAASLRRGILHNAHREPDGSWRWNYDRRPMSADGGSSATELWGDVDEVRCPYLLVRGGSSPVVDDEDVAELRRRRPDARVVVVDGAGHSVQGDRPLELAELLRGELDA